MESLLKNDPNAGYLMAYALNGHKEPYISIWCPTCRARDQLHIVASAFDLVCAFSMDEAFATESEKSRHNVFYAAKKREDLPSGVNPLAKIDPAKERNKHYGELKAYISDAIWIKSMDEDLDIPPIKIKPQDVCLSPYLSLMIEASKDGLQVDMDGSSYLIPFPRHDLEAYIFFLKNGTIPANMDHIMLETGIIGYMGHPSIQSLNNKDLVAYWKAKLMDELHSHWTIDNDHWKYYLPHIDIVGRPPIAPFHINDSISYGDMLKIVPEYKAYIMDEYGTIYGTHTVHFIYTNKVIFIDLSRIEAYERKDIKYLQYWDYKIYFLDERAHPFHPDCVRTIYKEVYPFLSPTMPRYDPDHAELKKLVDQINLSPIVWPHIPQNPIVLMQLLVHMHLYVS